MGYLKEFQSQIANHNYSSILQLWEEYCAGDEIEAEELEQILLSMKKSSMAEPFGKHVDKAIALWKNLEESPRSDKIFELIFDLQTFNTEQFRQMAFDFLEKKYSNQKTFNEKIRIIGLRNKENFQGAISNFELLNHMAKGKYVFHTGGWGVGEIIDISLVREQLTLEFDYVAGKKDLSFENAFNTLIPIPDDHFLSLRFGNPDILEQKAKKDPVEVIQMLLRDLGPKNAAEIKDELCDLVIPATDWARWWQAARGKLKKDKMIESPNDLKEPFKLRKTEVSHEERLEKALETKPDANTFIQMVYSFMRDFPETLKNAEFKNSLLAKLTEILSFQEITEGQELQIRFFIEDLENETKNPQSLELIKNFKSIDSIMNEISILSFKKKACVEMRKVRSDWQEIFLHLLFTIDQNTLRDYLLTELLSSNAQQEIEKNIEELLKKPSKAPEMLVWYFQKIMANQSLPLSDDKGRSRIFEAFLVLLHQIESNPEHKELVKKMYNLLTTERYLNVRKVMQKASVADVKEFLLLSTKCHCLTNHDLKIFNSLAEVVFPSLGKSDKKESDEKEVIWCTSEGYKKVQTRIHEIATVETVENAKEIEVARSHGDLRENSEFKFALEKRDRLQGELKFLSDQMNHARIITKDDISTDEVGIGTIVECETKKGQKIIYTLLGPWEANPDEGILSFQSKLALAMKGLKVDDRFQFQGEEYTIKKIGNYLERK